jgi:hypothetical protein
MNWKSWLSGIWAAFIGGGASAITAMSIDPLTFNMQTGSANVGKIFLIAGILSVVHKLQQSPLPPDSSSSTPSNLIKVAVLGFFFLGVQGCSSLQVSDALPLIRPAVSVACNGVLQLATSGQDKIDKANMVYACAKAVRTLASGSVPKPNDLKAVIDLWMPKLDHWANLSTTISGLYAGEFSQLQGNPQLAVEILEQISLGCEDAAGTVAGK